MRQRLKGPALAQYYPEKLWSMKQLRQAFGPELEFIDEFEEDRLEHIAGYDTRLNDLEGAWGGC